MSQPRTLVVYECDGCIRVFFTEEGLTEVLVKTRLDSRYGNKEFETRKKMWCRDCIKDIHA